MKLENVEIVQTIGDHLQNVSHLNEGRTMVTYANDRNVIHPNGVAIHTGHVRFRRRNPAENIIVDVSFYCENARAEKFAVALPPPQRPAVAAPQTS